MFKIKFDKSEMADEPFTIRAEEVTLLSNDDDEIAKISFLPDTNEVAIISLPANEAVFSYIKVI